MMIRAIKRLPWIVIGFAVGYLLDPVSGRSRRARFRDQTAARISDMMDTAGKKTRYEAGRARGVAHEMLRSDQQPADDQQLLQKVRSEAVGMVPGSVNHIQIDVDDGVVTLTGISDDRAREHDLIRRIRDVTGVRDIRNELIPD